MLERIFRKIWPTGVYLTATIPIAIASVIVAAFSEIIGEAIGVDHPGFLLPGTGEFEIFISSAVFGVIGYWGLNMLIESEQGFRNFRLIDHFRICILLYLLIVFTTRNALLNLEEVRHNVILLGTLVPAWIGIFTNFVFIIYRNMRPIVSK